jgi:hypothetical protein
LTVKNLYINQINNEKITRYNFSNYDNIFIFYRNLYSDSGLLNKSFLEIAKDYSDNYSNWQYKNIIVTPSRINNRSKLNDNLIYVIWFSSINNPYFNKDAIREKHIWKDVEWGKRKKNYSEKGKDPSNVWIPTEDDGLGHITKHILLGIPEIVDRLYKSTTLEKNTVVDFFNQGLQSNVDKNVIISALENSSDKLLNHKKYNSSHKFKENVKSDFRTTQTIYFTSSEKMPVETDSIQTVVTSPPYWDLKNYFKEGQIGQESYDEYLDRLNKVWKESARVLKEDGTIWINVNIRIKNSIPYFIPTDIIKQFREMGLYLIDTVIWHKSSSIPVRDNNLTDKYEVFLCFSKSMNPRLMNSILENFNEYKNGKISGGLIWNINRKAGSVGKKMVHPAIYPTELIDRVIQVSTDIGDNVLDPFLGSGTTLLSAIKNGRNGYGVEFNEGFSKLIEYRIQKEVAGQSYNIRFNTI